MSAADVAAIEALEDRRYTAMVAGDLETLNELMHPDCAYTHSNGSRDTKEAFIESLESGHLRYRGLTRSNEIVTIVGDTAIVNLALRLEVTMGGHDRDVEACATVTWTRLDGRWWFVAWQSCSLPPKK